MKTKLMALLLVAGGSLLAETHFSIGVQIGAPRYSGYAAAAPAPVAVVAYRPPRPGPAYVWIDGYRDLYGHSYNGYWAVPPYAGAYWVTPRYSGGHYYSGYWGGARRHDNGPSHFRGSDRDRDHGRGFRR